MLDLGLEQAFRTQQQLRAVHCAGTEEYVLRSALTRIIPPRADAGFVHQTVLPMDDEPGSAGACRPLYPASLRQCPDVGERLSCVVPGVFDDGEIVEIQRVLGPGTTAKPALRAHVALALLASPLILLPLHRIARQAADETSRRRAAVHRPPA